MSAPTLTLRYRIETVTPDGHAHWVADADRFATAQVLAQFAKGAYPRRALVITDTTDVERGNLYGRDPGEGDVP